VKLTRAKLEKLTEDLIEMVEGPCRQALSDAGLSTRDIDEVILVGGMTRMPKVQDKVRQIFWKGTQQKCHPDEAVGIWCCDPGRGF